jgi:hypothetical protein
MADLENPDPNNGFNDQLEGQELVQIQPPILEEVEYPIRFDSRERADSERSI